MNRLFISFLAVFVLCSCTYQVNLDRTSDLNKTGSRIFASTEPEIYPVNCAKMALTPIKTRQLYEDYYGTMITSDASSLKGFRGSYRWGITNPSPSSMAYFAAYVKPGGKYKHFRTYIYIDPEIKDTMLFMFRNNDRNGEVLKSISIEPGQTKAVDIEIAEIKRLYIGSELRINHDKATKMIFGEPEFYNCR